MKNKLLELTCFLICMPNIFSFEGYQQFELGINTNTFKAICDSLNYIPDFSTMNLTKENMSGLIIAVMNKELKPQYRELNIPYGPEGAGEVVKFLQCSNKMPLTTPFGHMIIDQDSIVGATVNHLEHPIVFIFVSGKLELIIKTGIHEDFTFSEVNQALEAKYGPATSEEERCKVNQSGRNLQAISILRNPTKNWIVSLDLIQITGKPIQSLLDSYRSQTKSMKSIWELFADELNNSKFFLVGISYYRASFAEKQKAAFAAALNLAISKSKNRDDILLDEF